MRRKEHEKNCKPARKELQIGEGGHKSRGSCCGRGYPPVRVGEMRRWGLDGWMRDAASRGGWGDGGMRRAAAAAGASLLPARGPGIAAAGPEKEMSDMGLHAGGKGPGGSAVPKRAITRS